MADLEEIHQGMELWKRRQVRLMPRHWQRAWLDVDTAEEDEMLGAFGITGPAAEDSDG